VWKSNLISSLKASVLHFQGHPWQDSQRWKSFDRPWSNGRAMPGLCVPMVVYKSWCLAPHCLQTGFTSVLARITPQKSASNCVVWTYRPFGQNTPKTSQKHPEMLKCQGLNRQRPCEAQSISLCLDARMAWHQCPPTGCFSANAECYVSFLRLKKRHLPAEGIKLQFQTSTGSEENFQRCRATQT